MRDPHIRTKESLSGMVRFRLKLERDECDESGDSSAQLGFPYAYTRIKIGYGRRYILGGVLRRDVGELPLTIKNIQKHHLKKFYFLTRDFLGIDKILIGDFQLRFHQGLVFYAPQGVEMHRPVKVKAKGIMPDLSTQDNRYFRGLGIQKRFGRLCIDMFGSYKNMDCLLDDKGRVKESLIKIRERSRYLSTDANIENAGNLSNSLLGARIGWLLRENTNLGFVYYRSIYSKEIFPPIEKGYYLFRGRDNRVVGCYIDNQYKNVNSILEYAISVRNGSAWLFKQIFHFKRYLLWAGLYDYEPDYYNEYSSGPTIVGRKDEDWNESGFTVGMRYKGETFTADAHFNGARHKFATGKLPSDQNEFYIQLSKDITRSLRLSLREWILKEDNSSKLKWNKCRLEIVFQALKNLRWRQRWERKRAFSHTGECTGDLFFIDLIYKLNQNVKIQNRLVFFDTPRTKISEIEFIWRRAQIPYYWQAQGRGMRFIFSPEIRISPNMSLWLKYENTHKIRECEMGWDSRIVNSLRIEYEINW